MKKARNLFDTGRIHVTTMKLKIGDQAPPFHVLNLVGADLTVPTGQWIHLQFRRFAGCPICNLHLRSFVRQADRLNASGIHEIVVFHSSREAMRPYFNDLPFDSVGDPDKILYERYGVEESPKAKASLKAVEAALKGMLITKPTTKVEGGTNGLPADFLIDPSGRIVALKYGQHAADHWEVDELLALKAKFANPVAA